MNIEDIKVNFFIDSLNLAQRAIYTGVILSIFAFWSIKNNESADLYTIPLIELNVPNFESFTYIMLILYLLCGMVASFAVLRAIENWNSIKDKELANTLLQIPNTLLSKRLLRALAYGFFFMVSYTLTGAAFDYPYYQKIILSCLLASPYFVATSYGYYLSPHNT